MVNLDWSGGQWTYKKSPTSPSISVSNNKGTNLSIDFKKYSEAVKTVGFWQALDNTQKNRWIS